jgi:electron transport complex protein RnfA
MSYAGIAFLAVFSGNVLLRFGAGLDEPGRADARRAAAGSVVFLAAAAAAAFLHALFARHFLAPLGLEVLDPLAFVLLAGAVGHGFAAALERLPGRRGAKAAASLERLPASCVAYGIALAAARGGDGPAAILVSSLAAAFGWFAATAVLDGIRERLELERVPEPFRGAPSWFISAGLVAMAFAAFDAAFAARIGGLP